MKKTTTDNPYFSEGWDARIAGLKRDANPYPVKRVQNIGDDFSPWEIWRDGWESADLHQKWVKRYANF